MEHNRNVIFFHTHDAGLLDLKGYPCVLTNAPTPYLDNSLGFSFPMNSPYRKLFSHFLLAMRQSGQIQRLYEKHTTLIKTSKQEHERCMKPKHTFFQTCRPNEPNCVPAIDLKIVITALIIAIVGAAFAILIALIERMEHNNQLNICSNLKNNMHTKYVLKKRGVLIITSSVLFISVVALSILLSYHTIGEDNHVITYSEFQESEDV